MPLFLEFDRIPLPNNKNPLATNVLEESGVRPTNQCKS
jgi:hypothetical protein